jgi:hypothetical protein
MLMPRTLFLLLATLSAACWVDPDDRSSTIVRGGVAVVDGNAPGQSDPLPSSSAPVLVRVDTDRTLDAAPGEGVGVFVEYAAGGKWHVWWTCDTAKTAASCMFDLRIASESGDIGAIHSEGALAGDTIVATDAQTIDAHSNTGSNAVGVRFDAPVQGIVSIDAKVGGTTDAGFFFFVQDGKPNGGYTGPLTNPLLFQGSTP